MILNLRSSLLVAVLFAILAGSGFVATLAAQVMVHDLTSDARHPAAGNTFRIVTTPEGSTAASPSAITQRGLAAAINSSTNGLIATGVTPRSVELRLLVGGASRRARVLYVDEHFAELFNVGLRPEQLVALQDSRGVAVTSSFLEETGVIAGRTVLLGDAEVEVQDGIPDSPTNSHLRYDIIAPVSLLPMPVDERSADGRSVLLRSQNTWTYVTIEDADLAAQSVISEAIVSLTGRTARVSLQPLRDIRLSPPIGHPNQTVDAGRFQDLYASVGMSALTAVAALFSFSALFRILLEKQREPLGVLAVHGHSPLGVVLRVVGDVGILTAVAVLASILAYWGLGHWLLGWSGRRFPFLTEVFVSVGAPTTLGLLAVCLAAALASPITLASPLSLLGRGTPASRRMIVASIAIGITTGICAAVAFAVVFLHSQIAQATKPNRLIEDVWVAEARETHETLNLYRALAQDAAVQEILVSDWAPYAGGGGVYPVNLTGQDAARGLPVRVLSSSGDPTPLLRLERLAGTELQTSNETACQALVSTRFITEFDLGSPVDALGRRFDMGTERGVLTCVITGVTRGQAYDSVRSLQQPTVYLTYPTGPLLRARHVLFRTADGRSGADLAEGIDIPNTALPTQVATLQRDAYRLELQLINILIIVGLIVAAYATGALLASFTLAIEQRTTEIGVRRALGESWASIAGVVLAPFAVAGLTGVVVLTPIAGLLGYRWAEGLNQPMVLTAPIIVAPLAIASLCLGVVGTLGWRRLVKLNPADLLRP